MEHRSPKDDGVFGAPAVQSAFEVFGSPLSLVLYQKADEVFVSADLSVDASGVFLSPFFPEAPTAARDQW